MPVKSRRQQRTGALVLTDDERARLLSRIVDEFERRGWRDDGHTAWALVRLVASEGRDPDLNRLEDYVGSAFRARNDAALAEIQGALSTALRSIRPSVRSD